MKFTEEKGDLFDLDLEKYVLAHCISADVTADKYMNAGIAVKFRDEFPDMARCIAYRLKLGRAIRYIDYRNYTVYNLISKKFYYHKASHEDIDYYRNLAKALVDMRNQMQLSGERFLGMPKIACGLDDGDWNVVGGIIKDVFRKTKIQIRIRVIDRPRFR